jgi:hypothetical protein
LLAGRFPLDLERAVTGFATQEGHAQERQCLGLLSPAIGFGPGLAPDFKLSRFLLRQFQVELLPALAEPGQPVVGSRLVLDTRPTVIGKTAPRRFASAAPTYTALAPEIEDVVEVDMGKEGRAHRALRRTDLSHLHAPLFHEPSLSHPAEQAQAAFISAPLPEQLQPPLRLHRLAAAADVSLYEEVDPLWLAGASPCVKTLVGATLGAIALATGVEQRLKQWCEHPLGGSCHACVFTTAAAQRPSLLTARLGNVYPALGVRSVSHPCEAS